VIIMRQSLVKSNFIILLLVLQFVPLVLFPPESFASTTQEWWLPVLLAAMTIVAIFQLVVRRSVVMWPWYLVSFAQGFNIISRLLMIMPHATRNEGGAQVFNTGYVILSFISMLLSAFFLWYTELPEVRIGLLREKVAEQ
jgi:hypothetical protein